MKRKNNGFGIVSLVCGITGLVVGALMFSPLAIIFGAIAMNKEQKFGTAGLVLGVLGLASWCLLVYFGIY